MNKCLFKKGTPQFHTRHFETSLRHNGHPFWAIKDRHFDRHFDTMVTLFKQSKTATSTVTSTSHFDTNLSLRRATFRSVTLTRHFDICHFDSHIVVEDLYESDWFVSMWRILGLKKSAISGRRKCRSDECVEVRGTHSKTSSSKSTFSPVEVEAIRTSPFTSSIFVVEFAIAPAFLNAQETPSFSMYSSKFSFLISWIYNYYLFFNWFLSTVHGLSLIINMMYLNIHYHFFTAIDL